MEDYPMMEVTNISPYVDHVYVYTKEKLGEDWNSAVQYLNIWSMRKYVL